MLTWESNHYLVTFFLKNNWFLGEGWRKQQWIKCSDKGLKWCPEHGWVEMLRHSAGGGCWPLLVLLWNHSVTWARTAGSPCAWIEARGICTSPAWGEFSYAWAMGMNGRDSLKLSSADGSRASFPKPSDQHGNIRSEWFTHQCCVLCASLHWDLQGDSQCALNVCRENDLLNGVWC